MSAKSRILSLGVLSGAVMGLLAGPHTVAQAAVEPPLLMMFPQHVSQADGLRMALTAALPDQPGKTGIKVTQEVDLSLQAQKWQFRFTSGSVAQIVNVKTGLCLQSPGVADNLVRQQKCVDPASTDDNRQFWRDRQTLLNGVVVHRYENLDSTLYLSIRDISKQAGAILVGNPLNPGDLSQMFKQKVVS